MRKNLTENLRNHVTNLMRNPKRRQVTALLLALALCAAGAAAVPPPAEEEPGWQPRVDGLASSEARDSTAPGSAGNDTEAGSAADAGTDTGTGSVTGSGNSAESGSDTEENLSDAVLFSLTEEAASPSGADSASPSGANTASSSDAAPAMIISEEEAAMAFDPEHPDGQTGGSTAATVPAEEQSSPSGAANGTTGADSTVNTDGTDSVSGTAPTSGAPETLPEVEALLSGPDNDTPSPAAGPDDGGVRETENLTERDLKKEEKLEQLVRQVTTEAERLDSLAFDDVEALARSGNLTVLGLEETIGGLESLDYDKLLNNLRDALNAMSRGQDMIQTQVSALQQMDPIAGAAASIGASSSLSSLQSSYNSMYQQFDAIYKGDTQRSNRDTARQLRNTIDQVVMGAETLYISLCALEIQEGALDRQLAALDRTAEEMDLRHELGQISDLQLGEVKSGRSALASGRETLGMNVRTLKMQLENMLGAVPTGDLKLGELPAVTQAQIDAMDEEADLLAAKERSWELYSAARTLEDQQETYRNALRSAHNNTRSAAYQQAVHTWNANQAAYNATVRGFDLRFRTLCEQVRDYYQVWNAARTALAQQNRSFQAAQLKYQQGNISQNALLSAKDELQTAMEKVRSSANDLFSAYNNYCWAVQHGILN